MSFNSASQGNHTIEPFKPSLKSYAHSKTLVILALFQDQVLSPHPLLVTYSISLFRAFLLVKLLVSGSATLVTQSSLYGAGQLSLDCVSNLTLF